MLRALALLFALLCTPVFAEEQPSTVDFLRSLHLDPAYRQDLRNRGYTGERFDVMVDHTRLLFSDREIIGGLERRIASILKTNGYKVNTRLMLSLDTMLGDAYDSGIPRLSAQERALLFQVDTGFLRALRMKDCNRLVSHRLSPDRAQKLHDSYMIQMPPKTLAAYYAATRSAMRRGLNGKGRVQTLNAAEVRSVEEAIFPVVDQMIGRQKNADDLYEAWASPRNSERYSCSFGKIFSAAALTLKGRQRDQAILYMMTR